MTCVLPQQDDNSDQVSGVSKITDEDKLSSAYKRNDTRDLHVLVSKPPKLDKGEVVQHYECSHSSQSYQFSLETEPSIVVNAS